MSEKKVRLMYNNEICKYILDIRSQNKYCSELKDSPVAKNLKVISSFVLAGNALRRKVFCFFVFYSILLKI